jgi:hypothetical protein
MPIKGFADAATTDIARGENTKAARRFRGASGQPPRCASMRRTLHRIGLRC